MLMRMSLFFKKGFKIEKNKKSLLTRSWYFLYFRIHPWMVSHYIKRLIRLIDSLFIFCLNILISCYRVPRDIVYFILFRPFLFLAQYMLVLNWHLYHDLGYFYDLIYYLLVESDVYDIQKKYRSFKQLVFPLSFFLIVRIYVYSFFLLKWVYSLFLFYYFSKLISYLILDFYQLLLNLLYMLYLTFLNILTVLYNFIFTVLFFILTATLEVIFFLSLSSVIRKNDLIHHAIVNNDPYLFIKTFYNRLRPDWGNYSFQMVLYEFTKLKPILLKKRPLPTWHYLTYPDLKDLGKIQLLISTLFVYLPIIFVGFIIESSNKPIYHSFKVISHAIYYLSLGLFFVLFTPFIVILFTFFQIIKIFTNLLGLNLSNSNEVQQTVSKVDVVLLILKMGRYSKKLVKFIADHLVREGTYKSKLQSKRKIRNLFQMVVYRRNKYKGSPLSSDLYLNLPPVKFQYSRITGNRKSGKKTVYTKSKFAYQFFLLNQLYTKYYGSFIRNHLTGFSKYFGLGTQTLDLDRSVKRNLITHKFRKVYGSEERKRSMEKRVEELEKEIIDEKSKTFEEYKNDPYHLRIRMISRDSIVERYEKKLVGFKNSLSFKYRKGNRTESFYNTSPSISFFRLVQYQFVKDLNIKLKYCEDTEDWKYVFELLYGYLRLLDLTDYPLHERYYVTYCVVKSIFFPVFYGLIDLILQIKFKIKHYLNFFVQFINYRQRVLSKVYYDYFDVFHAAGVKRKKFPWLIRFYLFIRNYFIKCIKILFFCFTFFSLLVPLFVFFPFIYFIYFVYITFIIPNHRTFVISHIYYRFMDNIETILMFGISSVISVAVALAKGSINSSKTLLKKVSNINLGIFNNFLNILLSTSAVIFGILIFIVLIKFIIPVIYLILKLLIIEIKTMVTLCIISIPYMFYYYPEMFPIIPYMYYNLCTLFDWLSMTVYYNTLYSYYKDYMLILVNTSDFLIIENYFLTPEPFNKDYFILNKIQKYLPRKYNVKRNSIYLWKAQYNLGDFIPTHPQNIFYYFKYRFYYDYLCIWHKDASDTFISLSRPYAFLFSEVRFRYSINIGGGNRLVDTSTIVYSIIAIFTVFHREFHLYLSVNNEQLPTNEIDEVIEDYIDYDLEFTHSEEFDSIEVLELERGNTYTFDLLSWLPEVDIYDDLMLEINEKFDQKYIKTELDFEHRFNELLINENLHDLYKTSIDPRDYRFQYLKSIKGR